MTQSDNDLYHVPASIKYVKEKPITTIEGSEIGVQGSYEIHLL